MRSFSASSDPAASSSAFWSASEAPDGASDACSACALPSNAIVCSCSAAAADATGVEMILRIGDESRAAASACVSASAAFSASSFVRSRPAASACSCRSAAAVVTADGTHDSAASAAAASPAASAVATDGGGGSTGGGAGVVGVGGASEPNDARRSIDKRRSAESSASSSSAVAVDALSTGGERRALGRRAVDRDDPHAHLQAALRRRLALRRDAEDDVGGVEVEAERALAERERRRHDTKRRRTSVNEIRGRPALNVVARQCDDRGRVRQGSVRDARANRPSLAGSRADRQFAAMSALTLVGLAGAHSLDTAPLLAKIFRQAQGHPPRRRLLGVRPPL